MLDEILAVHFGSISCGSQFEILKRMEIEGIGLSLVECVQKCVFC